MSFNHLLALYYGTVTLPSFSARMLSMVIIAHKHREDILQLNKCLSFAYSRTYPIPLLCYLAFNAGREQQYNALHMIKVSHTIKLGSIEITHYYGLGQWIGYYIEFTSHFQWLCWNIHTKRTHIAYIVSKRNQWNEYAFERALRQIASIKIIICFGYEGKFTPS